MKNNKNVLDENNCNRIQNKESNIIPSSYYEDECQDCVNFECPLMPNAELKKEKWEQDELDTMFPNGIDDGFNFSDFGEYK